MATEEMINATTAVAEASSDFTTAEVTSNFTTMSSDKTSLYVTPTTTLAATTSIPSAASGEIKNIQLGSTTYPVNLPSNANANINCVTTNGLIIQKSSNPVLTINNNGYLTTNESSLKISTNDTQTQITENGIFYNTHKAVVGGATSMLANVPYMIDFDMISITLNATTSVAGVNVYASAFNMSKIIVVGAMPYGVSTSSSVAIYDYTYFVVDPTSWTLSDTVTIAIQKTTNTSITAKLMILVMGY